MGQSDKNRQQDQAQSFHGHSAHWVFADHADGDNNNGFGGINPEMHQARFQQALALDRLIGLMSARWPEAAVEPRLSILLDLYINEQRGRAITVGDACIAARVPATTALRVIDHLELDVMVVRYPDRNDSRRRRLALQPKGQQLIETVLDDMRSSTAIDLHLN